MNSLRELQSEPASGVSFRSVESASHSVAPLPDFLFGKVPDRFMKHWFELYGLHASGVFVAEDMGLTFPYVLTRRGEYLSCAEANLHSAHLDEVIDQTGIRQHPPMEVSHFTGEYTILAGPGYHIYGHWIIDFLPKLQILETAGYKLSETKFLLPANLPQFALAILGNFGIAPSQLHFFDKGSVATADTLIIPTTCHNGLRCSQLFSEFCGWAQERVCRATGASFGQNKGELIFLARGRGFRNRDLQNRADVEKAVADLGFRLVYPEEMTLIEQWLLMSNSDIVVGEYGSALHSTVFGSSSLAVCAFHGPQWHPGYVQSGLGRSLRQPTGYIFGEENAAGSDAYHVNLDEFGACIEFLKRRPVFSLERR